MTEVSIDQTTSHEGSAETALSNGLDQFLGFLIKRLGSRADAEDVLQEFCIRVLDRRDQLRDVNRMDVWLFAILRSTLTDHYRKSSRIRRLADAYGREPQQLAEDPDEQMTRFCTCVTGLVSDLRPSDAELIRRIDFGEDDRATVANDLGLTRGALGVRLHRARAALRKVLLNHCGPCCQTDIDDCYCTPQGCESAAQHSRCGSKG